MLSDALTDVRYAIRMLTRSPGVALVAILTIGLGIGATTAIFSFVNAALIRPLPYPEPDRLVTIAETNTPNVVSSQMPVSPATFLDYRAQAQSFESLSAWTTSGFALAGGGGQAERVDGAAVSASLLPTLGVTPVIGRTFDASDDRAGAPGTVVLTYAFWQRRFAGETAVLGRTLTMNGRPYTIIGVTPPSFRWHQPDVELFVPLEQRAGADMRWRGSHYLTVLGRLKPGVTIEHARAEMNRITAALERAYPAFDVGSGVVLQPWQADLATQARPRLVVLGATVSLMLLVACLNVANLMLGRALARRHEITVRLALGSGRWRVARQMLVEGLVVSAAGGLAGILIGYGARDALIALAPAGVLGVLPVQLDARVLTVSVAATLLAGLVIGLGSAITSARFDIASALKRGGRGTFSGGASRLRTAMIVVEVAASVVLMVGAALLVRTFVELSRIDSGFRGDGLVSARVTLPSPPYGGPPERAVFFDRVLARLRETPGVTQATAVSALPLTGHQFDNSFDIDGRPWPKGTFEFALVRFVDTQYFEALGIPVERGRAFDSRDDAVDAAPVVLINKAMAARYFPNEDPIGKRLLIHMGPNPQYRTVTGIARDVRTELAVEPEPMMYLPYRQLLATNTMTLAVRGTAGANQAALVDAIRAAVRGIDPALPVFQPRTMGELAARQIAPWRFSMLLLTGLAVLAALLAAVGLAAVITFNVAQRTAEIGMRVVLGASRPHVVALVLGGMMKAVGVGLAIGSIAALWGGTLLTTQLYRVHPRDPAALAAALVALTIVAMAATWPAVRRAWRIDPLAAIRDR